MSRASSVCALRTQKFLLIIFRLAAPRFTTPINLAGPTNLGLLQSPPREGMHMRLFALVAAGAILYLPLTVRSQTDTALKLSTSNPRAVALFLAVLNALKYIPFESAASHFIAAVEPV